MTTTYQRLEESSSSAVSSAPVTDGFPIHPELLQPCQRLGKDPHSGVSPVPSISQGLASLSTRCCWDPHYTSSHAAFTAGPHWSRPRSSRAASGANFCEDSHRERESESVSCSVGLNLCNPMDYSPPGSSFHGIFRVRMLVRAAILFFRDFNSPGTKPGLSRFAGRFVTV